MTLRQLQAKSGDETAQSRAGHTCPSPEGNCNMPFPTLGSFLLGDQLERKSDGMDLGYAAATR